MSAKLTYDSLIEVFHQSEKPASAWRIGTESEKFGIYADFSPVTYTGPTGIEGIFSDLVAQHHWQKAAEYEGGPTIALTRSLPSGAVESITLEPAAQLELSGAPLRGLAEIDQEFSQHLHELKAISAPRGIRWLSVGFHPWATHEQLPWVPKLRYGVMRHYLPTRGAMALDMMRRTCTIQANLDYSSEEDAIRKLRLALKIQPIVTAMFANSPWVEGKPTGERSHRATVWLNVDPDRTGLLPFLWGTESQAKVGYKDYVEWALDVPMFMFKRGPETVYNTGQTFRDFMLCGFQGHHATGEDWDKHLATLFPEVRLKNTIEVRGADAQGRNLYTALPALWKGILYNETALSTLEHMTESWRYESIQSLRVDIARQALGACLENKTIREWAEAIIDVALMGLDASERKYLLPMQALIHQGKTPADLLLERCLNTEDLSAIAELTEI